MKKFTSLLLALLMMFSIFLGISTFKVNAESVPTCTVRVEGLTGTIVEGSASGATQIDIFKKVMDDNKINYHVSTWGYVDSINGLDAGTIDKNYGWMFYVKSADVSKGISSPYPYTPQNGDEIVYYYASFTTPYLNTMTFSPEIVKINEAFKINFAWKNFDWGQNKEVVTPIANAVVSIDDTLYTTDDKGTISVEGLAKGQHTYKISGYKGEKEIPTVIMDKGTFTVDGTTPSGMNYNSSSYDKLFRDNTSVQKNIDSEINLTSAKLAPLSDVWVAVSLNKLGININKEYVESIASDVKENELSKISNTTLEKYIIGLTAAGYTPYSFMGKDLVAELYNRDISKFLINDDVFGLFAYAYTNIPENYNIKKSDLVNAILNKKLQYSLNGISYTGWTYGGDKIDGDMTGIALCALSPFYKTNADVKAAVDSAVVSLSNIQNESGYITSSYGISSETQSFAILGLTSVGVNIEEGAFKKSKGDLLAAQLSFKGTDGQFTHELDKDNDLFATEEALRALISTKNFKQSGAYNYFANTVDVSKLSVYTEKPIIVSSEVSASNNKIEMPKTGSSFNFAILIIVAVILLAAGVIFIFVNKSKSNKK